MGRATAHIWSPRKGSKCQRSLNFNYRVNFKDFYIKLYVFSQIEDIKHTKGNFHSIAWVMPQGWDFGALGYPGAQNIEHGHVA